MRNLDIHYGTDEKGQIWRYASDALNPYLFHVDVLDSPDSDFVAKWRKWADLSESGLNQLFYEKEIIEVQFAQIIV